MLAQVSCPFDLILSGAFGMLSLRARLSIHIILPCLFMHSPPAIGAALSLKDVLQYSLQHAPKISQSQQQLRIRGWQYDQARAKFLPSLDVTSSQGLQKSVAPPWADRRDSFTAGPGGQLPLFGTIGLNLSETLYDNGQTQTETEISKADRDITAIATLQIRDETLLGATRAYYNLCQAQIFLETNQQQYQLLGKQLRLLEAMYHQGLKTKREFLRLQSEVQRTAVEVRAAMTNVASAEIELKRSIGVPLQAGQMTFSLIPAEIALTQKIAFPTPMPEAALSYDARIARLEADSAAHRVELARRKNLPQLSLSSGVAYQNPDYMGFQGRPQAQDTLSWNLTLGLSYNLWDNGTRRHDIDIAASQQQIHSEDAKYRMDMMSADIAKLMLSFGSLQESWQINMKLITMEQGNLKNIEVDYREGKIGYLDLISGINALLSAKINYFTTYFAVQQALAQYHFYEGKIFDAVAGI